MGKSYAQDLSLIIERSIDLANHQLRVLEKQADEFRKKDEIPKGWAIEFQALSKTLNDLTLSHARYLKANKDWLDRLTPEEKLTATKNAILALHADRPGLVRDWFDELQASLDDTRSMAERMANLKRAEMSNDLDEF